MPGKKPRGQKEDDSLINQWLLPELSKLRVADVTPTHARQLHRKITIGGNDRKGTPVRANRVADLARHLFNIAIQEKWREDNPFQNLKRNHEDPRERYLDEDTEIERLFAVLDTYPNRQAANLIAFLLYTGCRRGEAMAARWEQFSQGRRIWLKPSAHTKQTRTHRVPLSDMAITLLDEIYKAQRAEVDEYNWQRAVGQPQRDYSEFVFPASSASGHMEEIKNHWNAIRQAAGLKDLRIHDLRHSYASILINKGLSLQTVGQLLGHTQSSTTMRYAHLNDKSLRAATQKIGEVVPPRKSGRNS
jgi:integrase